MRVRYYCHYAALTGYGRAARDYLLALHRFGDVEIEIASFGEPGAACRSPEARYAELDRFARPWQLVEGKADVEVYHAQPRLLAKVEGPAWAARDAAHIVHGHPKRAALTTWETSRLPDEFGAGLARFDRVLVPSEFCADVVCGTTHGIDPIGAGEHPGILGDLQPKTKIIPHCFDPDFWVDPPGPRRDDGVVRFYSIGAWGERKNMLGVLRAYLSEFSKRDTVHLLLYMHNADLDIVRATIAASGLAPSELPSLSIPSRSELGGDISEVQLVELHASCDCFVTATRGEGWGLGIFEAAIMGRRIIAPLWGGQSDYLDHHWWIIDYNRQSLDATSADRMFERFDEIFRSCGWRVVELRYGKRLRAALKAHPKLKTWFEQLPNAELSALHYQGGGAWRERISAELGKAGAEFLKSHDDDALARLFTDLGGHCMETLVEAFDAAKDDVPTLFIAWTIKGFGLPFAGHKDNHAGLMNPTQLGALRDMMSVREGHEWEPLEGIGDNARPAVEALLESSRIAREKRPRAFGEVAIPSLAAPSGDEQSTQAAFGRILLDLSKAGGDLANRILTTSPDVTVSTNLGAWVNQRGLFRRREMPDVFAKAKIASAQKWSANNQGQHVELGIAESNLFLMLAAAGLSGDLFGTRLFPIGTLYDPFIARGLDALNYACYQDARFLLVATPSGITLGPEGGAHQSINPPLIALGQPGLRHYEPAYADELAAMMEEAFRLIDDPSGESTYLRLSTRSIRQIERSDDNWREGALKGAYWLRRPGRGSEAAIVAMGAVMPEAIAAWEELSEDVPGLGLLSVTSPDLLHRGWTAAQAKRWHGERSPSHIEQLLSALPAHAGLVTIADAAPASLSWIGGVLGQRVAPLGIEKFGQTGDLADLYAAYRIDGAAITEAVAELLLPA